MTFNGRALPHLDQIDPNGIDLQGYLRPGKNIIQVHLSTLIGNAAYNGHQSYGLLGPITVRPYGQTDLRVHTAQ
ncbi:hypothetical protein E0500_039705 [Streptomyces sp. KM273126]|uniref:hypothetical protein n=1 Tax=Streptomyces sp. KM273126 TaxID=2545247 RepID=UPI0015ECC145|nr:hypothetical protein [Streptomyces sp. KM273126]MBA2813282.1 hypothetical protein [Streptomyces sp. KM273126]